MKVAILSESPADEAALQVFVEAILAEPIETHQPHLRSRGYPSVVQVLPSVLKDLHYQRHADALVVVVDSDNSTIHQPAHDAAGASDPLCRFCQLRSAIEITRQNLRPIPNAEPIRVALAVPTPSIEAWYLFGDPDCTEAGWSVKQKSQTSSFTEIRRLKKLAYGTDRPAIAAETVSAITFAQKLCADLVPLEQHFPNSFGLLASELRTWIPRPKT